MYTVYPTVSAAIKAAKQEAKEARKLGNRTTRFVVTTLAGNQTAYIVTHHCPPGITPEFKISFD